MFDQYGPLFYDGLSDPQDFIKAFQMRMASKGTSDANKLVLLVNSLVGKAKRVFETMPVGNKTKLDEIVKELLEKCKLKSTHYEMFYQNRVLMPNELVSTYAISLVELVKKAHETMSDKDAQNIVLSKLCSSLPGLAPFINFGRGENWDVLLEKLDQTMVSLGGQQQQMMNVGLATGYGSGGPSGLGRFSQMGNGQGLNYGYGYSGFNNSYGMNYGMSYGMMPYGSYGAGMAMAQPNIGPVWERPMGNGLMGSQMVNRNVKSESEAAEANAAWVSERFNGKCFDCGSSGHRRVDCFKNKRKPANDNGGSSRGNHSGYRDNRGNGKSSRDGDYSSNNGVFSLSTFEEIDSGDESYGVYCLEPKKVSEKGIVVNKVTKKDCEVQTDGSLVAGQVSSSEVGKGNLPKGEDAVGSRCNPGGKMLKVKAVSSKTQLIRRNVEVMLNEKKENAVKLVALIDGGASQSVLNSEYLGDELKREIEVFKENKTMSKSLKLSQSQMVFDGATGSVTDLCVEVEAKVKVGSLCSKIKLLVSNTLKGNQLILGRDFLKANRMLVDHELDKILVRDPNGVIRELSENLDPGLVHCCVVEPIELVETVVGNTAGMVKKDEGMEVTGAEGDQSGGELVVGTLVTGSGGLSDSFSSNHRVEELLATREPDLIEKSKVDEVSDTSECNVSQVDSVVNGSVFKSYVKGDGCEVNELDGLDQGYESDGEENEEMVSRDRESGLELDSNESDRGGGIDERKKRKKVFWMDEVFRSGLFRDIDGIVGTKSVNHEFRKKLFRSDKHKIDSS